MDQIQSISPTSNKRYGIGAGFAMALVLLICQLTGNDVATGFKLLKYLLLGGIIVLALNNYGKTHGDDLFINGSAVGVTLSLVAAAILALINIIIFLTLPEFAFSKYTVEPTSLLQASMISMMLFFEAWVIGGIITFIVVQWMKNRAKL